MKKFPKIGVAETQEVSAAWCWIFKSSSKKMKMKMKMGESRESGGEGGGGNERKGRKKKNPEGPREVFIKVFQEKTLKATPLVSIKGRLDEERAMIHAVNSSESS